MVLLDVSSPVETSTEYYQKSSSIPPAESVTGLGKYYIRGKVPEGVGGSPAG